MQSTPVIALVDDDAAVLDSIHMIVTSRGMHAKCFTSASDFLAKSKSISPNCIVSDVRLPGLSGLDLQSELLRRGVTAPLILITGHGDIAMAVKAIKAGAFDFIEKPFDNETLMESISTAIDWRERARIQNNKVAETMDRLSELSLRQRQVMDLVVQGLSSKQIAGLRLAISPRTVENYRAWVMQKMGAGNFADLVRKWFCSLSRMGTAYPPAAIQPNRPSNKTGMHAYTWHQRNVALLAQS